MNFQIDEKATLNSILTALRAGNKAEHIAKAIDGISQKPFLKALKMAGYEYSNKVPKGWHYIGEDPEPLDKSIFDYVNFNSTKVNISSPTIHPEVTQSNTDMNRSNNEITSHSPVIHPQFTQNEVSMLMEILYEWQGKEQSEQIKVPTQVHERIKALPQNEKTRKTIVIDKKIGDRLDTYCKSERVNKSDILHLAIMDFLNKVESR
ncbi:hypothetical protein ACQ69O_005085 [Escherichia coli]|uniref:hypothetical protein n=1 Tax=Solibacillus sp. FSL K6-1126 TaxID=2921463 RepID=UPI0030FB624C